MLPAAAAPTGATARTARTAAAAAAAAKPASSLLPHRLGCLSTTAPLYNLISSTSSKKKSVLHNVSPLRVVASGMEDQKLREHFVYHREQPQPRQQKPPLPRRQRTARRRIVVAAAAVAAATAAAIVLLVQNWQDDIPTQVLKLEEKLKKQQVI